MRKNVQFVKQDYQKQLRFFIVLAIALFQIQLLYSQELNVNKTQKDKLLNSYDVLHDSLVLYAQHANINKAKIFNEKILEKAKRENYSAKIAESYLYRGKFAFDADTNLFIVKEYLDTAISIGLDKKWLAHTYILYQSVYERYHDFENIYKSHLKVLSYGEKNSNYDEMAKSLNMIGNIHYSRDNLKMAISFYRRAYNYASLINDSTIMSTSLNNIGIVFIDQHNNDSAYYYMSSALRFNIRLKNIVKLSINYTNLGNIAMDDNKLSKAYQYYQKALEYAMRSDGAYCVPVLYVSFGEYYIKMGDNKNALKYLLNALEYSNNSNNSDTRRILKLLIDVYLQNEDIESIEKYFDFYVEANDTVSKRMRQSAVEFLKVETQNRYEKEKHIHIIESKKKELKLKINLLLILVVLIITVLLAYIIYKQQKNKLNQSKLKEDNLKLEKKLLNTELTDFSLQIIQRNRLLNELNNELKSLSSASVDDGKIIIRNLVSKLSSTKQNRDELEILQEKIDQINTKFYYALKERHNDLSKNEIHLCALFRINLSIKDIASLKNISPKSAKMAKYRLRKKLKISSDINISSYLKEI